MAMDEIKHESPKDFSPSKTPHPVAQHEASEIDLRVIFNWLIVLLVTLFVSMAIARLFMRKEIADMKEDPQNSVGYRLSGEPSVLKTFPEPRLQFDDVADMKAWRAHEESILNHYGWADRNAKIVRVPIQRAMQMLLEKGIPSRGGVNESDLE